VRKILLGTQSNAATLNSRANFFHFKILPPTCFLSRFCGKGLISPAAIRNKTDILASWVQKNVDTHIPLGPAIQVRQTSYALFSRISRGSESSAGDTIRTGRRNCGPRERRSYQGEQFDEMQRQHKNPDGTTRDEEES
jgi:hypothetical protein